MRTCLAQHRVGRGGTGQWIREEIWIQGGSRKNDIIWLYPSLFSMSVAWPGTGLRKLNKQAAVFYNSLCKKTYVTQKGESKLTSYFIAEGSCQA